MSPGRGLSGACVGLVFKGSGVSWQIGFTQTPRVEPLSSIADARTANNPSTSSILQLWAHTAELNVLSM